MGRLKGKSPGPTVVALGGMHGNEPSGVEALKVVLKTLEQRQDQLQGEFVALTGNLRALAEKKRYIDQDLNRMWKLKSDGLTLAPPAESYEKIERMALQEMVTGIIAERTGPMVFLDLHTTSSESPPFLICGDTLRNRDFISDVPVPKILGLDEMLNGPFMSYLNVQGHLTIIHEAGQHDNPESKDNQIAFLWTIIAKAGLLKADQIPELKLSRERLREQAGRELQGFFEVRRRYVIREGEEFRMLPGYRNFQPIREREHLANCEGNPVFSPFGGRIFMPLYQKQGDDGFFIIRKIPQRRIRRGSFLRRIHFYKLLPYFPGIRRHPDYPDFLLVNPRFFRRFGPSLLNVMGYRRRSRSKGKLLFIKRPHDLKGPSPLDKFQR